MWTTKKKYEKLVRDEIARARSSVREEAHQYVDERLAVIDEATREIIGQEAEEIVRRVCRDEFGDLSQWVAEKANDLARESMDELVEARARKIEDEITIELARQAMGLVKKV